MAKKTEKPTCDDVLSAIWVLTNAKERADARRKSTEALNAKLGEDCAEGLREHINGKALGDLASLANREATDRENEASLRLVDMLVAFSPDTLCKETATFLVAEHLDDLEDIFTF